MFLLGLLHSKVEGMALLTVQNVLLQLIAFHLAPDALDLLRELLALGGLRHVGHLDVAVHVAAVDELFPTDEAALGRIRLLGAIGRVALLLAEQCADAWQSCARRSFLQRLGHEREVERLPLEQVLDHFGFGLDALVDRPLNLPNHRIEIQSLGLDTRLVLLLRDVVSFACGFKAILSRAVGCVEMGIGHTTQTAALQAGLVLGIT